MWKWLVCYFFHREYWQHSLRWLDTVDYGCYKPGCGRRWEKKVG